MAEVHGMSYNSVDYSGRTMMMKCVGNGNRDLTEYLLRNKVSRVKRVFNVGRGLGGVREYHSTAMSKLLIVTYVYIKHSPTQSLTPPLKNLINTPVDLS